MVVVGAVSRLFDLGFQPFGAGVVGVQPGAALAEHPQESGGLAGSQRVGVVVGQIFGIKGGPPYPRSLGRDQLVLPGLPAALIARSCSVHSRRTAVSAMLTWASSIQQITDSPTLPVCQVITGEAEQAIAELLPLLAAVVQ